MSYCKKRKCYNCKFASKAFKIDKLTHHYCEHPDKYSKSEYEKGIFTMWDMLRVFSDTCRAHSFQSENTSC